MPQFLVTWLMTALALVITAYVVPGIQLDGFNAALIAAIILGLVNAVVRPLLILLTLPITIITLGLFLLVINALSIQLVAALTSGFAVSNLLSALIGSLVLSFVSGILDSLIGKNTDPS
ncbi:phage holin family protein [Phormidium yuhuli AB48]|uniref:Phage holin family protein n=1 Tax=Phormidium yuhuli AB48 TaxID=2940671 RepID=A0ABY5AXH8_9CYAN|nr:phage holin family protein [Phormidium yuhuli]USR92778.1 phage holin family protein [Phormidium yuhuli AB48]